VDLETMLQEVEGFAWDAANSRKSRDKHRVDQSECEEAFFNHPVVAGDDIRHSVVEARFFLLGVADSGRRLFVVFTVRQRRIRVISARDMSRKERGIYDGKIEESAKVPE
jgi:uncharacterized DUF497 family protein